MAKVMKKDQLQSLLGKLVQANQLIAPVDINGVLSYKKVNDANAVVLDFQNSLMPPKDYFFPQSEQLFSYTLCGEAAVTAPEAPAEQVMFGVRPCDMKSLNLLDKVFDAEFNDAYYMDKRAKTTIIGLSCDDVAASCFCGSFAETGPCHAPGYDVQLTKVGDDYLVEVFTEKGEKLIAQYSDCFADGGDTLVKGKEEKEAALSAKLLPIDITGVKEKLDKMWAHPIWDGFPKRCLGCGTCTYICPTCHCFDMQDYTMGCEGERMRCWDSCQFPDFTLAAGGHQPRTDKGHRMRQRFNHKLKYFVDRYGDTGCVGCGRCITKCPTNIDIAQVINEVKEAVVNE